MSKIFSLVCAVLMVLACSVVRAENRALIVGIGKYANPSINLPGIEKDVEMMRQVARLLGYEDRQIRVLADEEATAEGVKRAMTEWLVNGVTARDQTLFYFSGHGTQMRDISGDEEDGVDEVLVTHDVESRGGMLFNVFLDDQFGDILARIPSGRTLVFIDACHSGTATRSVPKPDDPMVPKFFRYEGMPVSDGRFAQETTAYRSWSPSFMALSAARDNELAQASSTGSFFTKGLHNAVKDAARTGRHIDMKTLRQKSSAYIDSRMKDPLQVHHPVLSGEQRFMTANLFLSREPSPVSPSPIGPSQPTVTLPVPALSQPAPSAATATDSAPSDVALAEPSPSPGPSAPAPAAVEEEWWRGLREVVSGAAYSLDVSPDKTELRLGEELTIACRTDRDGYLNVVNLSPGDSAPIILFPNKYHPNNQVRSGETVFIPAPGDGFVFRAQPPKGKSLVVVLHTTEPRNFFLEGEGKGIFRSLSSRSLRGFRIEEKVERTSGYGAAMFFTVIK